jgi:hypothetical protein
MRLHRAVPKIPAKSSAPPRLPLHKTRSVKSPSESALPQLLIPLHFNSRISNTYKKPQGEGPVSGPKVLQLVTKQTPRVSPPHYIVTSLPHSFSPFCVHAGIRATPIPSIAYSRFSAHPRWGVSLNPRKSSLRDLSALCVSSPGGAKGALSLSLLGFRLPPLCHPERSRGICFFYSLPHYLVISLLRSFTDHVSPHLYRRRNTAKMNDSSRPHGHTI